MSAKRIFAGLAVLTGFGFFALPAWAGAITVNNFSFETPDEGTSGASVGCPPGWTCTFAYNPPYQTTFSGGVYAPVNPTQYQKGTDGIPGLLIVPDGKQAAWMGGDYSGIPGNGTIAAIEQNTVAIVAKTTYILNVWAGARADQTNPWVGGFTPTIEIMANGVVVASLATTNPGSGKWGDFTLSWTSPNSGALIGETLGIALAVPGRSPGDYFNYQINWDDVTLNSVPEPASLALFGTALVGLVAIRRRKRTRALLVRRLTLACAGPAR